MTENNLVVAASEIAVRAAPVCEVCGLEMWWHGSVAGYGCPGPDGGEGCASALHRPKDRRPWPFAERYPDLADG